MSDKITRKDVARLAGVSETTVSVVLNHNREIIIADATRERVLAAAKELGYTPNYAARAMAGRHAGAIGVLSPWTTDVWFFAQMLDGIRAAAEEEGYGVLLCGKLEDEGAAQGGVRYYREKRIDGIVYLPPASPDLPGLGKLLEAKIPVVLCNGRSDGVDSVMIDHARGIRQTVEKMQRKGFHRFLYILPDEENRLCAGDSERLAGFRGALGGADAAEMVFPSAGSPYENIEAAKRVLRELEFPCGIVCCYWNFAYYIQEAARAMGLKLGQDVSVTAGDRPSFTEALYPPLDGIELPFSLAGQRAAECLLKRIKEGAGDPSNLII